MSLSEQETNKQLKQPHKHCERNHYVGCRSCTLHSVSHRAQFFWSSPDTFPPHKTLSIPTTIRPTSPISPGGYHFSTAVRICTKRHASPISFVRRLTEYAKTHTIQSLKKQSKHCKQAQAPPRKVVPHAMSCHFALLCPDVLTGKFLSTSYTALRTSATIECWIILVRNSIVAEPSGHT